MAVFRVEKTKNYTVMSNYHLKDKNLTYKAKGMLSYMLSLPEDWDYSMNGLCTTSKESIKAIRNILKELKENYYLKVNKLKGIKGHYEYEYLIYEHPYTQKGDMEKVIQINTDNKDKKDKSLKQIFDELNTVTKMLLKNKFIEETDLNIFDYDNLFNELLHNYDYKTIIVATKYTINKIKLNKYKDENNCEIINIFGYFKESLISNIEKITTDIDLDWQ